MGRQRKESSLVSSVLFNPLSLPTIVSLYSYNCCLAKFTHLSPLCNVVGYDKVVSLVHQESNLIFNALVSYKKTEYSFMESDVFINSGAFMLKSACMRS
jgi:hypothetical protein